MLHKAGLRVSDWSQDRSLPTRANFESSPQGHLGSFQCLMGLVIHNVIMMMLVNFAIFSNPYWGFLVNLIVTFEGEDCSILIPEFNHQLHVLLPYVRV